MIDEYVIKTSKKAKIVWSDDGLLFALYLPEDQDLRIYKVDEKDIESMVKKIKKYAPFAEFIGEQAGKNPQDIGFVEKI